jgi:ribonuclease HII
MALTAGIDEAGRGALAGPVVSSAVILPERYSLEGLNDSKLLSPKRRSELFDLIQKQAISIGVGFETEGEIDKSNILQATYKSMQRAIGGCNIKPEKVLIDGSSLPNQIIPNEGIINGDSFVPSIQAASIIAKVTRDNYMIELDTILPEYGFKQHKGYGTKFHLETLKEWKSSPVHRKSFSPVKRNLPSIQWYIKQNKIGWLGEKLAALHLMKSDCRVVAMNEDCSPYDRIDIIAKKNETMLFFAVRTSIDSYSTVLEDQIDKNKINQLYDSIQFYIKKYSVSTEVRLDGILVTLLKGDHKFNWIKGLSLN